MKVIQCKVVEEWDGGDRHNFAFRISLDVSDEEIKSRDRHCLIRPETLIVFDSLEEKDANSRANLRRSAWAKLSPQERLALGLSEPK
ncbi:hypothetical protein [Duganella sp. FT27W]|uniref:hypothetical protein n=1 Tax=Duganella sp. FT27W TaxID=2654636 RepID=UPI00128BB416|nr:hypothetical protein [Duganella sp. FT27W]MPQ56260.1 hypothetical protein [Duganella sp. FT27W]